MKEKEPVFDRKKHILYSKTVKKVMLKHLTAAYGTDRTEELWEKIQKTYVEFLKDLPFIGGKKNTQAGSVYDSIALFAYYEAVPVKPDLAEMDRMNRETFVPAMQALGFLDMNRPWVLRLAHFVFWSIAKRAKKQERKWAGNYHMKVRPYDREKGIYYEFTNCPIAEFAKRHGYAALMPAFCNADYPMLKAMHGGLIRKNTCAQGGVCDYWIVGDRSRYLKKHPAKTDGEGYVYNE